MIITEDPLISVIVPVYNVEPYLDRCVSSIVNQTFDNLEIILVDDGSPDNCPSMCDGWAEKDRRIKVVHKKNGGLSDARNAGIAVATGKWISFVDSDDWLDLRFLEILYGTAVENDCQVAECEYIVATKEQPNADISRDASFYSTIDAMEQHLCDSLFRQVVWNKLYRRDIISAPFKNGKYHEDVFWTYQIIANCKKLAHVHSALYFYFQRDSSIMGQPYSLKRLDAVEAAIDRCKFVSEHFPNLAGLAQGQLIGSCMYHYQLILDHSNVDPHGNLRKWVYSQAKHAGNCWKKDAHFPLKQKIWLKLYLIIPQVVCCIRNRLKIGT